MGYFAKSIADSISPTGVRITTLECKFPRFILAEMNTHRVFSRNSASSRAIPPERLIESVQQDPFVPETFGRRVKGMGVGEDLASEDQQTAERAWLWARDKAVTAASMLIDLDVDKSRINRLLEPFMWHTAIITSTEWDNFFGLRAPDGDEWRRDFGAQPEMQIIAIAMRNAMQESEPQQLQEGWWHLPYAKEEELAHLCAVRENRHATDETLRFVEGSLLDVCSRRLARVSFDKHNDSEQFSVSVTKAGELKANGHFSPFEHLARPLRNTDIPGFGDKITVDMDEVMKAAMLTANEGKETPAIWKYIDPSRCWSGNLRGWLQYRKTIPYESNHMEVRNVKQAL